MLKIAGLHRELTKTNHRSKIGAAFHRMLVSYDNLPQIQEFQELFDFLKQTCADFAIYEQKKEDAILFGNNLDLKDLKRESGMRLVPTTRQEFKICSNPRFVAFM